MAAESTRMDHTEFTNPNLEVLFSAEQITERVKEMGAQISRDYEGKDLVLVGVLKGSCVFLADLMRANGFDVPQGGWPCGTTTSDGC